MLKVYLFKSGLTFANLTCQLIVGRSGMVLIILYFYYVIDTSNSQNGGHKYGTLMLVYNTNIYLAGRTLHAITVQRIMNFVFLSFGSLNH